jgi:hypothetical protein
MTQLLLPAWAQLVATSNLTPDAARARGLGWGLMRLGRRRTSTARRTRLARGGFAWFGRRPRTGAEREAHRALWAASEVVSESWHFADWSQYVPPLDDHGRPYLRPDMSQAPAPIPHRTVHNGRHTFGQNLACSRCSKQWEEHQIFPSNCGDPRPEIPDSYLSNPVLEVPWADR